MVSLGLRMMDSGKDDKSERNGSNHGCPATLIKTILLHLNYKFELILIAYVLTLRLIENFIMKL